jgi:hypothetical protein
MIEDIHSWEYLEFVWQIAEHLRLSPNINSTKFNNIIVITNHLLPELGKIRGVFICGIIDLYHPNVLAFLHHIMVVLGS